MFFNLFSKKQQQQPILDNKIVASITYFVNEDDDNVHIDVILDDYDEESIEGLANILNVLGEDASYIDTINIIKSALMEDQKTDVLIKVISKIHNKLKEKTQSVINKKISDEPCVKPSEMAIKSGDI